VWDPFTESVLCFIGKGYKTNGFETEVTEIPVQFFIELNGIQIVAYDQRIKENFTFDELFFYALD
jgi:hypothetical protein